jgi:hypothetical protein
LTKRPYPFAFVFDGQPPAEHERRASATSVWTPIVVASQHDAGLYTDLKREMLDNQQWQAQRIIGERQTPSGLEYHEMIRIITDIGGLAATANDIVYLDSTSEPIPHICQFCAEG